MARKPGPPGDPAPAFPVETLRHWYVTPFGGMSTELGFFQVGINRAALERNTTLDPSTDRVRVTVLGRMRRPILCERLGVGEEAFAGVVQELFRARRELDPENS